MIGVDIIDHEDSLLRKRDERSFRLIRNERDHHSESDLNQEQLFWLYWVAKEAIYKAKRERVRFDPKKIEVKLVREESGWAFISENIQGILEQNSLFTFGICAVEGCDMRTLNYDIFDCSQMDQSASVRNQMVLSLQEKGKKEVSMTKDAKELPVVLYDGEPHLATFTHHHRLMAYICE